MNKRKKRFLALFVGAMCTTSTIYSSGISAYAEEKVGNNISNEGITENVSSVVGEADDVNEEETVKEDNNENIEKEEETVVDDNSEQEITVKEDTVEENASEKENTDVEESDNEEETNTSTETITVEAAVKHINDGQATLEDYETLDLSDVFDGADTIIKNNYEGMTLFLKGKNITNVSELRDKVMMMIDSVKQVENGDLVDYVLFNCDFEEVKSLTDDEQNMVVNAIQKKVNNMDDRSELKFYQILYDEIQAVKGLADKINRGEGTLEDYETLDLSDVFDGADTIIKNNYEGMTLFLKGKNITNVSELRDKVMMMIDSVKQVENGDLVDYVLFNCDFEEVKSLTDDEQNMVVNAIQKKVNNMDDRSELKFFQLLYDTIQAVKALPDKINNGQATFEDYQLLGFNDDDENILKNNYEGISLFLKGENITNLEDLDYRIHQFMDVVIRVQSGVDVYWALNDSYCKIEKLDSLTNFERSRISDCVQKKIDKVEDKSNLKLFQPLYDAMQAVKALPEKFNNGEATFEDYEILNYRDEENVLKDNYEGISLFLKGKNITNLDDLDYRILQLMRAAADVKNGSSVYSVLDWYKIEEIDSLTKDEKAMVINDLQNKIDNIEDKSDLNFVQLLYDEIQAVKSAADKNSTEA